MMPDMPSVSDAPLEEFVDPQSAIASILGQMQGAATRSRPPDQVGGRPLQTVQESTMAVPSNRNRRDLDEFIRMLLAQQH